MTPAGSSREAALDRLVLQYLEKRKYSQAERSLRSEASSLQDGAMALAPPPHPDKGIVDDLLFYLVADNDAKLYITSFDRLATWVDNSLDRYRPDLQRILYPLLVHTYLALVDKGAGAEAAQLLARHQRRFAASKTRSQELGELAGVGLREQVAASRLARTALARRTPVRMGPYAAQLLTAFLQGARLYLLLGLLNEHVSLQVVEGAWSGSLAAEDGEDAAMVAGQMQDDVAATNHQPLQLSLLHPGTVKACGAQSAAEARWAEREAVDAAQDEDGGDAPDAGTPSDTPQAKKRGRPKAAERRAAKRAAPAAPRMEPQIPLPAASETAEAALVADLEARCAVGPQALPSAAFFTFVNTHRSLNCVAFSSDGAHVAGGFADASVRVFDMSRRGGGASGSPEPPAPNSPGATHLVGHSGAVYGVDFTTPDARLLLSGSGDGTVRLWSTDLDANLAAYRAHGLPVWDVAAGPAGLYFASGGADRVARIWSTERGTALRVLAGHHADVAIVRWHPNAHYVATGSDDRTVRLWDMRSGQAHRILLGHHTPVTALALSPDGRLLAAGDEEGTVLLWDLGQAKRLSTLQAHAGPAWALAFSHGECALLASGGADNTVRLWDTVGEAAKPPLPTRALRTLCTKATPVIALAFTPRNLLLGSGALTLLRR